MPNIHYISDLHLDTGEYAFPDMNNIDIVVVAGDLADFSSQWNLFSQSNKTYFDILKSLPVPVVFVPGNHDFFSNDSSWTIPKIVHQYKEWTKHSNVHVLFNESIYLKGIHFIGLYLATDFHEASPILMQAALNQKDFSKIYVQDNVLLTPQDYFKMYRHACQFLEKELQNTESIKVVISHHVPSTIPVIQKWYHQVMLDPQYWNLSRENRYEMNLIANYSCNNPVQGLQTRPEYWVHGHIHEALQYSEHTTYFLCNPRGKACPKISPEDRVVAEKLGITLTQDMIERDAQELTHNPFRGECPNFHQNAKFNTSEGVYPLIQNELNQLQVTIKRVREELNNIQIEACNTRNSSVKAMLAELFGIKANLLKNQVQAVANTIEDMIGQPFPLPQNFIDNCFLLGNHANISFQGYKPLMKAHLGMLGTLKDSMDAQAKKLTLKDN